MVDINKDLIPKLYAFASKHQLTLNLEDGECGMGRPCVGFHRDGSWAAYNPIEMFGDFDVVAGFEDESISRAAPKDAYHKSTCLAVLVVDGDRDEATRQLAAWVDAMDQMDVEVVRYATGARGTQALISGTHAWAVRKKGTN